MSERTLFRSFAAKTSAYYLYKYVFAQYVKYFTCWNQLLIMMFGQQCNHESMRDLIIAIEAYYYRCYHLKLGKHITRSNQNQNQVNTNCDYRIFEECTYYFVSEVGRKRAKNIFKLNGNVYAFDT